MTRLLGSPTVCLPFPFGDCRRFRFCKHIGTGERSSGFGHTTEDFAPHLRVIVAHWSWRRGLENEIYRIVARALRRRAHRERDCGGLLIVHCPRRSVPAAAEDSRRLRERRASGDRMQDRKQIGDQSGAFEQDVFWLLSASQRIRFRSGNCARRIRRSGNARRRCEHFRWPAALLSLGNCWRRPCRRILRGTGAADRAAIG
jgi:hypothetical protein